KVGDASVIIKMPNKYQVKVGDTIKMAIEIPYARFFNETTTNAITEEHNEYEEIVNTKSLDEDNVTIIKKEKKGLAKLFSRKK
ncbi:MAG: hypothetical protein MJ228_04995, partial [Bacilli bacterium]|nr:hypothetical protein [Bacilli bacterium]